VTQPSSTPRFVRFGLFELDLTTGELRKKGAKVALQEQPFQVLAMLVEAPGELVSRETLRQRLWPDSVFVDFDHGLNKAVAKIRTALGDLAESPRYVETLERRGYRFIAAVESVIAPASGREAPRTRPAAATLTWGDRSIPLGEGTHVLGRDPSVAVWIDSVIASRRHAAITVASGSLIIEDLGSHNGTFVNGRRLDAPSPLADGDEIRVGPATLAVHTAPPDDLTRSADAGD
jgi:DNA-binding winged helix-turn-helix (wHTH) protein